MPQSDATTLVAFVLTSLIIEITPGPNMAYLIALSLASGWRAGLGAVAGITLGLSIIGFAAAFGLATLISESVLLYEVLRWAGVGYLLWLAWDMWWHEPNMSPTTGDADKAARTGFRRGLITNLLNPKAAIFYIVVIPTFVRPAGSLLGQTLMLTGIYVMVATLVHAALALLAGALQPLVASSGLRRVVVRALALGLVAIAVWVAVSTHR